MDTESLAFDIPMLTCMAVSGVTKSSVIRYFQTANGCTDADIEALINLCSFKSKPKKIDYDYFYKVGQLLQAENISYPFTQIYKKPNFLNKDECNQVIKLIDEHCERSCVANSKDEPIVSDYRTSKTADLSYIKRPQLFDIDYKITKLIGLNPLASEVMQGQRYDIGQYYKQHCDYFKPLTKEYKTYCEWMGQRTWTFMIYLNDVEEGGETYFKHLKLKVKPEQGTAVILNNLYRNGLPNPKTLHEALPPVSGKKYIITKWFRSWSLV